jgi:hypothetical protein
VSIQCLASCKQVILLESDPKRPVRSRACPRSPRSNARVIRGSFPFISYSQKDKKWLERLKTHLKPRIRNGKVDVWNDQRIQAGKEWRKEIDEALARAKVAVLMVSPHFLASDFIAENELPPLLEAAKRGSVKILWVPVSTAAYEETSIYMYQAALAPSKPLDKHHYAHVSDAMETICKAISEAFSGP